MNEQEAHEKQMTEEILCLKCEKFGIPKSLSEFEPDYKKKGITGPDIKVQCTFKGESLALGIELTRYQVDSQDNDGSPARRLKGMWDKIYEVIEKIYFPKYPFLKCLHARPRFDISNPPPKKVADSIACELVQFLLSHHRRVGRTPKVFRQQKGHKRPGDFDNFPYLKQWLKALSVYRVSSTPGNVSCWWLGSGAGIAIVEQIVVGIIAGKAKKKQRYELRDVDESWLIIYADGETVCDRAGPEECKEDLRSAEVTKAAKESGFDRIIFWERVRGWQFEIPQE